MNTAVRGSPRLQSIDVWRGLAALAVVAIHMRHDAPGGFREHPFFLLWFLSEYGYLGVSLFVVISGFCIHRGAALAAVRTGQMRLDWVRFWKRRFWRIYPTYLAAMAFSALVFWWLGHRWAGEGHPLAWDIATHLLLVHNLTDEFSTSLGNGVYWSLGMEEQLYGLYAVLFVVARRVSVQRAVLVAAVATVAWRILTPWILEHRVSLGTFHLGSWYHWPMFYWLHWALGAWAADAHAGRCRLPRWFSSPGLALGLLASGMLANRVFLGLVADSHLGQALVPGLDVDHPWVLSLEYLGELGMAIAFFCLVNWGLALERDGRLPGLPARLFAPVGRMSYSLYLVHIPVLLVLEQFIPQGGDARGWMMRGLLYWPAVLAVSALFYFAVERWFLNVGRGRQDRSPSPARS